LNKKIMNLLENSLVLVRDKENPQQKEFK